MQTCGLWSNIRIKKYKNSIMVFKFYNQPYIEVLLNVFIHDKYDDNRRYLVGNGKRIYSLSKTVNSAIIKYCIGTIKSFCKNAIVLLIILIRVLIFSSNKMSIHILSKIVQTVK